MGKIMKEKIVVIIPTWFSSLTHTIACEAEIYKGRRTGTTTQAAHFPKNPKED